MNDRGLILLYGRKFPCTAGGHPGQPYPGSKPPSSASPAFVRSRASPPPLPPHHPPTPPPHQPTTQFQRDPRAPAGDKQALADRRSAVMASTSAPLSSVEALRGMPVVRAEGVRGSA